MSVSSKKRSKKGSLARQRQKMWQSSSVVWRASETVGEEVNAIVSDSPFLKGNRSCDEDCKQKIAFFRRSEIVVGKLLGQGGFAEVFEVKGFDWMDPSDDLDDTVLQQEQIELRRSCELELLRPTAVDDSDDEDCRALPYALKQLRRDLIGHKGKNFQRAAVDLVVEAEYLASLSHPNILKIRGLTLGGTSVFRKGQHDQFFIMMDRLSETLKRRIQHLSKQTPSYHPLDLLPVMIKYALDIGNALEYMHERFILFRDLKPANFGFKRRAARDELGGEDDAIQFFDFGLCRELPRDSNGDVKEDETYLMSGVGTQRYMAPEIVNRQPYNLKADVYSWAMVLFEMITLAKPFPSYTMEQHTLFVGELGERPILPTDVNWPEGLNEFLERAWKQEISERLSISQACRELQVIRDRIRLTETDVVVEDDREELQQEQQQQQQLQRAKQDFFSSNSTHSSVVLELPSNFDSEYRFPSKKTSRAIRKPPKKVLSTNSSSSLLENTMELTATSGSIGTAGMDLRGT